MYRMDREETDLMQNTPPPGREADSNRFGEHNVGSNLDLTLKSTFYAGHASNQVFPFCVVKIWPKDADSSCRIQEAVSLFEQKDQQHFQISEKIREKVFDREMALSRLKDLKNYNLYRLNGSVNGKLDILTHLYLALDKLSFANKTRRGRASMSCSTEEELDNHKLTFKMLHRSKNLAEEKQLLREMNVSQQRDAPTTSPLAELSKILDQIQWKYGYNHHPYKPKICDRLLEEIKQFEVTRKNSGSLRESMKDQVKIICDELMEMRRKKGAVETKIKLCEKELVAINEEIWSFHTHMKEKHCRKEASLLILKESKGGGKDYWILKCGNLEYESMHTRTIFLEKSSLKYYLNREVWKRRNMGVIFQFTFPLLNNFVK